jgi:hypothetical protein
LTPPTRAASPSSTASSSASATARARSHPPDGVDDERGRDWLVLLTPDGARALAFQQVERLKQTTWPDDEVPQQMHLDIIVPDKAELDRQHDRALRLGATLRHDRSDDEAERLRTYTDPAGHLFCVIVAPS